MNDWCCRQRVWCARV